MVINQHDIAVQRIKTGVCMDKTLSTEFTRAYFSELLDSQLFAKQACISPTKRTERCVIRGLRMTSFRALKFSGERTYIMEIAKDGGEKVLNSTAEC